MMSFSKADEKALLSCRSQLQAYCLFLYRGNRDKADDLCQTAYFHAYRAAEKNYFREGTNIRGWLFTIARNAYFSEIKKGAKFTHTTRNQEEQDYLIGSVSVGETQHDHLVFEEVIEALGQLSAEQREVLILAGQGYNYEEIAEKTGTVIGTVKSRVCRARIALEDHSPMLNRMRKSPESAQIKPVLKVPRWYFTEELSKIFDLSKDVIAATLESHYRRSSLPGISYDSLSGEYALNKTGFHHLSAEFNSLAKEATGDCSMVHPLSAAVGIKAAEIIPSPN